MAEAFEDNGEGSIGEIFNDMSAKFDELCQERHKAGQKEYGEFTFLGNDVVRMMMEELADTANYCRYQFIKLMILQELILEKTGESGIPTESLGIGSFKGAGEGWQR